APHFTFVEECDTKALSGLRSRLNEKLAARGDAKLSYLPFIAKALVAAFRKYPDLNSNMDEARQELIVKNDVNLGIGAATEQGLTVFVVKDIANLSLREIGAEIDRLARAALGVHRIQQLPVVNEGRIEIGERMNLSCSFDHRVIDGHIGAAFLYEVIRALEAPELLLADR